MAYFLAKTDPQHYSIDNLEQEQTTVCDGVRNAAALLAIRAMRPDDNVLIYHSQSESIKGTKFCGVRPAASSTSMIPTSNTITPGLMAPALT